MGNDMSGDLCLVLDIGGTNTRIALTQGHTLMTDRVQKYANADYRFFILQLWPPLWFGCHADR